MKEQEIVEYLKGNRTKGVAFGFMPNEVKEWVETSSIYTPYLIFNGEWKDLTANETVNDKDIIALPGCYFAKQGGWEEYEIKDGRFYEEQRGIFYAWHEWSKCMSDNPRFTAFGGWQYKNYNNWFTAPQLQSSDGILCDGYDDNDKPLIPVKIRFWRKKQ